MCGVESDLVRHKLIEKGAAFTLTDAITTTRSYETVQSQLAAMTITQPTAIKQEVDSVATRPQRGGRQQRPSQGASKELVAVKRAICLVNRTQMSISQSLVQKTKSAQTVTLLVISPKFSMESERRG